jgi:hypothetical protein
MTLPGFSAEIATAPAGQSYGFSGLAGLAAPGVVAAGFGLQFPLFRCCRRAPLLGNRFVCTQQRHLPWETCTCTATLTGPVITCTDNGLGSFEAR